MQAVADGAEVVEIVDGVGGDGPMRPWTCFPLWCAGKPVLHLAALAVAEQVGLGPDDQVAALVPGSMAGAVAGLTLADLSCHTGGLHLVSMATVMCADPRERPALALEALADRASDGTEGYGEILPWVVAEAVVEHHHGERAGAVLDSLLADVGVHELHFGRFPVDEMGWYWGPHEDGWIPMLGHAVHSELAKLTPSLSGVGSARGLASWYRRLGEVIDGRADHGVLFPSTGYLTAALARRRDRDDAVLGRRCGFAAGLATPLDAHGVAVGSSMLGLAGWLGRVLGFLDLERGVSGAVVINGLDFDHPERIEAPRDDLLTALLDLAAPRVLG